jgi:hypothetical protein
LSKISSDKGLEKIMKSSKVTQKMNKSDKEQKGSKKDRTKYLKDNGMKIDIEEIKMINERHNRVNNQGSE